MSSKPLRCNIVTTAMVEPRLRFLEYIAEKYSIEFTVYRASDWWYRNSDIVKQVDLGKQPICINWWPNGPLVIHYHHQAVKAISKKKCDFVIGFGYSSATNIMAQFTSRIKKIPYILWTGAKEDNEVGRDIFTRKIKRYMNRSADYCLASSSLTMDFMQMYGVPKEKLSHALYAIDNEAFEKKLGKVSNDKESIRQKFNISSDKKVVLCVSRVIWYKCIDVLLKAWKTIDNNDWVLVIAGDGPDYEKNLALAGQLELDNLNFLGNVPHEEIHRLYCISDLFVLPSAGDIWGLVINEAMLASLPVVTTKMVGAYKDMIIEGENGFVVEPNNIDQLADSLKEIMVNPALCCKMGTKSKEIVAKHNFQGTEKAFIEAIEHVGFSLKKRVM